ncbi:MAG: hypothetical protein NC898_04690 [Candidatus Omnitrophica bacterium]|nr:hypothetical protein [Candidatus Omnitrophota bacterium]MCM8793744.1 hypothetical protein [Candidatus Omnitrophota bacterium]
MKGKWLWGGGIIFLFLLVSCGKAKEKSSAVKKTELAMVEEGKEMSQEEQRFVEGEVLVKFKPEISAEEIVKIVKEEYQCEIMDVIEGLGVYRLKLPKGKKVLEMVETLRKDERVKYAEPNIIYRLQE